jgi:hypothetical protein
MSLYIPYSSTTVADMRLPNGCQRWAFVHIGYADQASPRDVYGHFGPVVAPVRLAQTVSHLADSHVTGVMAYSEGMFDDVNKALLAGLGSGQFRTADEVLRAYARRYFHADEQQAGQWAQWLAAWGRPFDVDPQQMAQQLALLSGCPTTTCGAGVSPARAAGTAAPQNPEVIVGQPLNRTSAGGWRQRQWELKLELFRLNKLIGAEKQWTPARLEAVDQFWQVQEQIHRGLWGLTLLRHIFGRSYTPAPWYADWAKQVSTHAKTMGTSQ